VTEYKIYCLDSAHRLMSAISVKAVGDHEALHLAKQISVGSLREVWNGNRLIGRIDEDHDEN
jgi:hypothetical protein